MDSTQTVSQSQPNALGTWWPVLLGLFVLFVPTYITLANTTWHNDVYAHGPIILAVVLWQFWKKSMDITELPGKPSNVLGGSVLLFGLLLYILGRSQDILLFEVGSEIFIITGTLLLLKGTQAIRIAWFPILFLVFLIPLPSFMLDAMTGPLKQEISIIVDNLLYAMNYPISRSGVVLSIGPYQLLIADACSGLNSMYALSALGILFVYLRGRATKLHNTLLLLSILPIAFLTNIVRVIALVLVTYYQGDAAGASIHDIAAAMEFIVALMLLMVFDGLLIKLVFRKRSTEEMGHG